MISQHALNKAAASPTFLQATAVWAKIGFLSFGGPAGQIALMHKELVEERRWISESRFLHALNYCMLLPGPEAQQLATYIGWLLHGTRGGVVAGTLFVLPGFLVILALSSAYALFQDSGWLGSLFFGVKAAVLAIVLQALMRMGRRALKTRFDRVIAALAFTALFFFDRPFPLVILIAGIAGLAYARAFSTVDPQPAQEIETAGRAASLFGIDDGMRSPPPSWKRNVRLLTVWLLLWAAPFVPIALFAVPGSAFAPIALFFSKMAVVTFGGAYAVLAYVAQQAVEHYHWLKPGEMLDGLALAETTPGPLVLVLSFVGFMGAFRNPGGLDPLLSGFLGALLATWVTFIPCFLWIFLGAPYVERLKGNRVLSAALAAISAAVTGVILNLAVWFGLHVLFSSIVRFERGPLSMPLPVWDTLQPSALLLALLAGFLLFRLKRGVLTTLAVCAAAGWMIHSL